MSFRQAFLIPLLLSCASLARAADSPKPEDFQEVEPVDRSSLAPFDEFQSAPRYVNIRIDPIAPLLNFELFLRQWGATIDFAIARNVTLGPSIRGGPSFKSGNSYAYIHKVGVTGGWYLNGTRLTNSIAVWPSWYFTSIRSDKTAPGDTLIGTLDAREVSLLAGFQWFFQRGWNMNVALGAKYRMKSSNIQIRSAQGALAASDLENNVSFSSELMLGWAF